MYFIGETDEIGLCVSREKEKDETLEGSSDLCVLQTGRGTWVLLIC